MKTSLRSCQTTWTRTILFVAMIAVISCSSLVIAEQASPEKGITDTRINGIPLAILKKADLHVEWAISQLALEKKGSINQFFYKNGMLYVIDNHNLLSALDGKTGVLKWTNRLSTFDTSCSDPTFYEDSILFVVGNTIVEVSQQNGMTIKSLELDFSPSTCVARSEKFFYIGSENKKFYCLKYDSGLPEWHSVQPAAPTGTIALNDGKVYFSCLDDTMYVSQADERQLLWTQKVSGTIPEIVIDNGQCYVPSTDTSLYCYSPEKEGDPIWKYFCGGALFEAPILTEKFAYQYVNLTSLLCLERVSPTREGSLRWELKDGFRFLAENGTKTYIMTLDNELTIMNNTTGKRMISLFVPTMNLFAQNTENNTLYMASKSGSIIAIKPNTVGK